MRSTVESTELDRNREQALDFVRRIEAARPEAHPHTIANLLRRHTRPVYTEPHYTIATFSRQEYIDSALDLTVSLCFRTTDFAHFIASLSDRITLPGFAASLDFATAWTGKHSSWSGDLGQAVLDYRQRRFRTMEAALNADASELDLTADVAAARVGEIVNITPIQISDAIVNYHATPYFYHVKEFVRKELDGQLQGNVLTDAAVVENKIQKEIAKFLMFAKLRDMGRQVKFRTEAFSEADTHRPDVRAAARYFLDYLLAEGRLTDESKA